MTHKIAWIGASLALSGALALLGPGFALAGQESESVPGIDEDKSLTEQLGESQGVITPPPVGSPDIYVPAPNPDPGTTPVIPPSDLPGGDPRVQPK
jgi:hypothetical protein